MFYLTLTTMKNESFQIADWDDLVFENRNRMYGSYQERKRYADDTMRSFLFVIIGIGVLMLLPSFMTRTPEDVVDKPDVGVITTIIPPTFELEKKVFDEVKPPKLQPTERSIIPTRVTTEEVIEQTEEMTTTDVDWGTEDGVEGGDPSAIVYGEGEGSDTGLGLVEVEDNNIYLSPAIFPKFGNGTADMVKFLSSKLRYPSRAKREHISGTVYVEFVVNKKGEVVNPKVIRGIARDCDQEALRVVSLMKDWAPGSQNGMSVNVRMVLPITFRLDVNMN
jgi:protein TonB